MTCEHVKIGGFSAIVCRRGERTPRCKVPGCRDKATILCDYPVARGKRIGTCDRGVCPRHAKSVGADRDYCDRHRDLPDPQPPPDPPPEQLGMFGGGDGR